MSISPLGAWTQPSTPPAVSPTGFTPTPPSPVDGEAASSVTPPDSHTPSPTQFASAPAARAEQRDEALRTGLESVAPSTSTQGVSRRGWRGAVWYDAGAAQVGGSAAAAVEQTSIPTPLQCQCNPDPSACSAARVRRNIGRRNSGDARGGKSTLNSHWQMPTLMHKGAPALIASRIVPVSLAIARPECGCRRAQQSHAQLADAGGSPVLLHHTAARCKYGQALSCDASPAGGSSIWGRISSRSWSGPPSNVRIRTLSRRVVQRQQQSRRRRRRRSPEERCAPDAAPRLTQPAAISWRRGR